MIQNFKTLDCKENSLFSSTTIENFTYNQALSFSESPAIVHV